MCVYCICIYSIYTHVCMLWLQYFVLTQILWRAWLIFPFIPDFAFTNLPCHILFISSWLFIYSASSFFISHSLHVSDSPWTNQVLRIQICNIEPKKTSWLWQMCGGLYVKYKFSVNLFSFFSFSSSHAHLTLTPPCVKSNTLLSICIIHWNI